MALSHWWKQGKIAKRAFLAGTRDRILADFRHTRFTWPGFLRWAGIVLAAFVFAGIVTLYFLDWNQMRGPIARYASARLGREVRIDGDLKVDLFRWQPHISVAGLYIGNPAWVGGARGAASVRHAALEFRLIPALFGKLILPSVALDGPDVLMVRDGNGRTNWDGSGKSSSWNIPPIQRFLVTGGHLEIDDAVRKLKFLGQVSSRERAGATGNAFQLTGDGTLNGNKFLAEVHGGALIHVDQSRPYHFTADIHAGDTHAIVDGAITHPFHLSNYTARINFTGDSLSYLYYLTGLTLPGTPPYHLTGVLKRDGGYYTLNDLAGRIGQSDLRGNLSVDVSGPKPDMRGHLSSRTLYFDDMGALFGGGKQVAARSPYLLPDTPLHTERLRQMNADVDYDAAAIVSRDIPLRGLTMHIALKDGVLNIKPMTVAFTQGKLSGGLAIDARRSPPTASLDARLDDIAIENFIKSADKPVTGAVEARAQLAGTGNSVHLAAATANGQVTVVIPSGQIRHSLAEWAGVDVISALGLSLGGDRSNTGVRCAVAHFRASNGQLTAQQFVFDTDPVRVDGSGGVNLRDETLDLTLAGKPKSFQILRLRAPIRITGKLAAPALSVDAKPAIAQGAIGAGLAILAGPAAILAFIDPGLTKDANCAGLLTQARAEGAPVKAGAAAETAHTGR